MIKLEIPAKLKRLLDYGTMKDEKEQRQYKFYDFEGKEKSIHLGSGEVLSKEARCPRDGVRIAGYLRGHRVSECPNCGYSPSQTSPYSREKDLADLAERIETAEAELAKLKATQQVIQNPNHPVVQANLRDSAMTSQSL